MRQLLWIVASQTRTLPSQASANKD